MRILPETGLRKGIPVAKSLILARNGLRKDAFRCNPYSATRHLLRRPEDPDEEVACDYCREGEWNADLHEVAEADLVTFFSKHSDTGDIRGSADRC